MTQLVIVLVLAGMALVLWRGIKAPTTYDRILVVNAFGSKAIVLIVLVGVLMDDAMFLDIALIYALVNFITTIGFLKFFKYHSLGKGITMGWDELLHILSSVLLLAGGLFMLMGSVGIWRMPEFFTRLHPASVCDSLGLPLLLLGVLLHGDYGLTSIKILMLMAFAMITSATASHALAKAALHSGLKPMGEVEGDVVQKKTRKKK